VRDGALTLAGVCDTVPIHGDALAGLGDPPQSRDLVRLLDEARPDITIVCTPIHTHADLAVAAMERGSHVLLEKPPAPTLAEYERIRRAAERTGRACQVGFQDLASEALPAIARMVASGAIGAVRGVGGACAWVRPTTYFRRSAWAGRRELDGRAVVDGALTNPFAHAVASALHLSGATTLVDVSALEVELYRANPIEADDTSCVRIHTRGGTPVTVAATLCAAADHDPYLVVHGTRGRITLYYKRGEVRLVADGTRSTTIHPRADLLENLIAHVVRPDDVPLRVPLSATEAFMAVVEAVRTAPSPAAIPVPAGLRLQDKHGERFVVPGIDELVTEAAESLSLYSELGAVWATYPIARMTPPPGTRADADLTIAQEDWDGGKDGPPCRRRQH
jgi:predicted dehydrogenase